MESFLQSSGNKKGINKTLLAALGIGAIIVLVAIGFLLMRPTTQQIQEQVIENAFHEGSPEFEQYTKKISIQTDEKQTTWSPTGMGTIVMNMRGIIRNMTGKTLTGLEIRASVVDSFGKPIKAKEVLVIPKQADRLEAGQTLPVQVLIEGFNQDDDRAQIRWKVTAIKIQD